MASIAIAKLVEEATLSGSTEFADVVTEYFTHPSSELDISDESDSDHHEERLSDDGKFCKLTMHRRKRLLSLSIDCLRVYNVRVYVAMCAQWDGDGGGGCLCVCVYVYVCRCVYVVFTVHGLGLSIGLYSSRPMCVVGASVCMRVVCESC